MRFSFWLAAGSPVGVFYVTCGCAEQFTQEDLHWLTAYASISFYAKRHPYANSKT